MSDVLLSVIRIHFAISHIRTWYIKHGTGSAIIHRIILVGTSNRATRVLQLQALRIDSDDHIVLARILSLCLFVDSDIDHTTMACSGSAIKRPPAYAAPLDKKGLTEYILTYILLLGGKYYANI